MAGFYLRNADPSIRSTKNQIMEMKNGTILLYERVIMKLKLSGLKAMEPKEMKEKTTVSTDRKREKEKKKKKKQRLNS